MDKITYINKPFERSINSLIGEKCTFVTAAGFFSGTILSIQENYAYELQEVIFRPLHSLSIVVNLKVCEVYGPNIIASIPLIEPLNLEL